MHKLLLYLYMFSIIDLMAIGWFDLGYVLTIPFIYFLIHDRLLNFKELDNKLQTLEDRDRNKRKLAKLKFYFVDNRIKHLFETKCKNIMNSGDDELNKEFNQYLTDLLKLFGKKKIIVHEKSHVWTKLEELSHKRK